MSKKKKIFIMSHAMELGGAERALLGLLESFDYSNYTVDLFLMRQEGELLKYIPKEVNLLSEIEEYTCLAVPISRVVKKRKMKLAIGRVIGKFKAKRFVNRAHLKADNGVGLEYSHKYTKRYMPMINSTNYDLAISFLTPHYFVSEKVIASKKIAWIHTDYSFFDIDVESERKMWEKYDYVASISDDCKQSFLLRFPEFASKIVSIENIISPTSIRKQADADDVSSEISKDSINILSIGRFTYQKNFDNVPDICRRIIQSGLKIKWYLIGFGNDETLIKEKIIEAGMKNFVIILGKKANPYPYINACDVYIQPSRYEGKCVAVREAQILGKPVIITDYPTSASQLVDGYDGKIVAMDNKKCARELVEFLNNHDMLNKIKNNVMAIDYSNKQEIEKIYKLL